MLTGRSRSPGQCEAHAGERGRVELVEVGERRPERRRTRDDRDAAVLDRLHRRGGVEPLHEHDRGADAQAEADDDVQSEDVEQRQHPVEHVIAADVSLGRSALIEVGSKVRVGEHGRARRPGGSAGEHQSCKMVAIDLDDVDRRCSQEIVERHHTFDLPIGLGHDRHLDRRHGCTIDVRPVGGAVLVDDHDAGADHGQLGLQFRTGARRVERHGDSTQPDGGEVRHDEVWRIADDDGDAVVDSDAGGSEPATKRSDLFAQLAVGGGSIAPDECNRVVVVTVDDVREIHGVPLRSPLPRSGEDGTRLRLPCVTVRAASGALIRGSGARSHRRRG